MRIIDPHVHVWKNDPAFPWAPETTNPPREDATPEMLLELMAANGVEKTVLVQVIHYRWDNRYTADALRRYPDKFMGVRSEEHTSELQSRQYLVCRLLLEKKNSMPTK